MKFFNFFKYKPIFLRSSESIIKDLILSDCFPNSLTNEEIDSLLKYIGISFANNAEVHENQK